MIRKSIIHCIASLLFFVCSSFADEAKKHSTTNSTIINVPHFAPGTKMVGPLNFMFPKMNVKFFPSAPCPGTIHYLSLDNQESVEVGINVSAKMGLQLTPDLELKALGEQMAVFQPNGDCSGTVSTATKDSEIKSIDGVHIGRTGLLWKAIYIAKDLKLNKEQKDKKCSELYPQDAWNHFDIEYHKNWRESEEFAERKADKKFRLLTIPLGHMVPKAIARNTPDGQDVIYCLGSMK